MNTVVARCSLKPRRDEGIHGWNRSCLRTLRILYLSIPLSRFFFATTGWYSFFLHVRRDRVFFFVKGVSFFWSLFWGGKSQKNYEYGDGGRALLTSVAIGVASSGQFIAGRPALGMSFGHPRFLPRCLLRSGVFRRKRQVKLPRLLYFLQNRLEGSPRLDLNPCPVFFPGQCAARCVVFRAQSLPGSDFSCWTLSRKYPRPPNPL